MATWVKSINGARINIDKGQAVFVGSIPEFYGVDAMKVGDGKMTKFAVLVRYDMKDKLNISMLHAAETKEECERYLSILFAEVPSISPLLVPNPLED